MGEKGVGKLSQETPPPRERRAHGGRDVPNFRSLGKVFACVTAA